MKVNSNYLSPNFDNREVDMGFIVLHYTACLLEDTLTIFSDPKSKVSAHFVIDTDGQIYNCVELNKPAWHAGVSYFCDKGGKKWKNFNDFSIGVELVNFNGNLFPYSGLQYKSLFVLVKYLQNKYPLLNDSNKILGHEHIAGFRGKADPGYHFNWKKLLTNCYEKKPLKVLEPIISKNILNKYQQYVLDLQNNATSIDYKKISTDLEQEISLQYL